MKTNVTMIRRMGSFEVCQRTKDGMFNSTELLKQWNRANGSKKEMFEFLRNDQTKAFIEVLKNEEYTNTDNSPYLATRGNKGATWMHPFLFIKFAMWINPRFEYQVIKFVYDQLIQCRHNAGDRYRSLTNAARVFPDVNYPQLAKALNYIVFGRHEDNLRQTASEDQLRQLSEIENQMAFSIDMGYIKSFEHLIYELRKLYRKYNRAA